MNEPNQHPVRNERGLPLGDRLQHRQGGHVCVPRIGVVSCDHIVQQLAHGIRIAPGSEILECPNAYVACGHAGQYCARQCTFAKHLLAGGDHGKRSGGCYA